MPICLRLFGQLARFAVSRTRCTAGRSKPISTAMMAMTTRSSMSVNAQRFTEDSFPASKIEASTEMRGQHGADLGRAVKETVAAPGHDVIQSIEQRCRHQSDYTSEQPPDATETAH